MEDIVNILIADDNKGLVELMKLYISKDTRFKIIGISEDKKSEIEMIDKLKPHLVITDIRKKREWAGLDIIEKYKDNEYTPIFFVISASVMDYYEKIRELKVRYYLPKPYTEDEFLYRLNNIYNDIFPKQIVVKENNVIETSNTNQIIKFFKAIKKRIGI